MLGRIGCRIHRGRWSFVQEPLRFRQQAAAERFTSAQGGKAQPHRSFSSRGWDDEEPWGRPQAPPPPQQQYRPATRSKKGFPVYSIYGPECLMSVRPIFPTYKEFRTEKGAPGISVARKGRMLVEFIPRVGDDHGDSPVRHDDPNKQSVALAPEEIGLMLHNLDQADSVEFSRNKGWRRWGEETSDTAETDAESVGDTPPDKLFRVGPSDQQTGSVDFSLHVTLDNGTQQSMKVTVNPGGFFVLRNLLHESIGHISGWTPLMETRCDPSTWYISSPNYNPRYAQVEGYNNQSSFGGPPRGGRGDGFSGGRGGGGEFDLPF